MRTVSVKLMADASNLRRGLQSATTDVKGLASELDGANKKGSLDHITDAATGLGLGLLGVAGTAVKFAADFDKQMSAVGAATHASSEDMDALRQAAIQAGKDTQFSATKAAEGITELSKAGVSTADVLGGGLKGALDLAAAGQLDVGEAAETAASALTQFRLKGADVPHVADLLAAAAGKAQGSVHDMGYALNQSGLVASQFGLSIEDTTGALAEFANAGLIGSDAGTSFKTMLLAMANPSKITAAKMHELGISFYDAQGQFIGLSGVAAELQDKLGGLTEEERNAALGQIYGNDAIRAATVLYKDGAKGVEEWRTKVDDSGYAAQTAAKLTDNLAGDVERLKGSLETMAIEGGSGANSGLRVVTKSVSALVDEFGQIPPAVSGTLVTMAGLGGVLALSLVAWIKLRGGIATAVAELNAVGPAGARAATGLQAVSKGAGIVAVAFAGLEVAGAVFDQLGRAAPNVDKLTSSLENLATTGKLTGGLTDEFGANLDDFALAAQSADSASHGFWKTINGLGNTIPGVGSVIDSMNESLTGNSFDHATEQMTALDQSFSAFIATQKDGAKASDIWNQLLAKSGLGTEQLAALLPGAYKKLGELNTAADQGKSALDGEAGATKGAAGAMKDMTEAMTIAVDEKGHYKSVSDALAAATLREGDAMKQLSKFMHEQADPVFALIQAQKDLKKAQDDASEAIRRHGKNSTEARAATEKLVAAAIDLQGAVGDVGAEFDGKMSPALRTTLRAAGLTKAEIAILTGEFKEAKKAADQYTGKYEAKVSAPGAVDAKTKMADAWAQAKGFDGQYNAKLTISGDKAVDEKIADLLIKQRQLASGLSYSAARSQVQKDLDRNNQKGYHAGGWTGPGGMYDEAGVVHADEHVIRKASRRKIESKYPGALDAMNETGDIPEWVGDRAGYALGGRVTWPMPTSVAKTKLPTEAEAMAAVGGIAGGSFGNWPSSPGAQRGDSGVWRKIVDLVKASGIPYDFGNGYRPGDPLWHGSGRAVDFMGFNQDRLAQFFEARQGSVLELIHRSKSRDYGITRGHYNAMPHQWPLHKNHLHVAMADGGVINEPVVGVGASGTSYSFGERGPETVTPGTPNYLPAQQGGAGGGNTYVTVQLNANLAAGANPREHGRQIAQYLQTHLAGGGQIRVGGQLLLGKS